MHIDGLLSFDLFMCYNSSALLHFNKLCFWKLQPLKAGDGVKAAILSDC